LPLLIPGDETIPKLIDSISISVSVPIETNDLAALVLVKILFILLTNSFLSGIEKTAFLIAAINVIKSSRYISESGFILNNFNKPFTLSKRYL